MYSRKYGVFYFADEREAVKLTIDPELSANLLKEEKNTAK